MGKVRAILSEFGQPFAIPMAKKLIDDHNWDIRYWIARSAIQEEVMTEFPDCVFHVSGKARRGLPPEQPVDFKRCPLDAEILARYAFTERHALAQSDRLNLYDSTFTYGDRLRLYHHLLGYWLGVVEEIKPDVVVFLTIPHVIYDYVLYDICRAQGVKTIIFEKTNIVGLIYAYEHLDTGPTEIAEAYSKALAQPLPATVELSQRMEQVIAKAKGDYKDAVPIGLINAINVSGAGTSQAGSSLATKARDKLRGLWSRISIQFSRIIAGNVPLSVGKLPGRPLADRSMSRLEYVRTRMNIRAQKKRLLAAYTRLSAKPDLSRPYIYVTLQHQPEQAANPQGGEYQHQYLMVETLAALIPDGWSLYVKEHVASLLSHSQFERNRTPAYYEALAKIPAVTLVSPDMGSFDLIDNARAVATISGSAGWEAVLRGKPALLFGYSWYRNCEGVFQCHTVNQITSALEQIETGYAVEANKVRLYLSVLESYGINAYNLPSWGEASGFSVEENGLRIAAELVRLMGETAPLPQS